jgi:hypothetical protein
MMTAVAQLMIAMIVMGCGHAGREGTALFTINLTCHDLGSDRLAVGGSRRLAD